MWDIIGVILWFFFFPFGMVVDYFIGYAIGFKLCAFGTVLFSPFVLYKIYRIRKG